MSLKDYFHEVWFSLSESMGNPTVVVVEAVDRVRRQA